MNLYASGANRLIPWCAGLILSMQVCGVSIAADGGLQLSQTRVIFDASAKDVQTTIKNHSNQLYLIKAGVFATPDARINKASKDPAVPFMMTPPLFRLEPDSQSNVLIVRNGTAQLPSDRESVFYLSFLAIPATSDLAEKEEPGVSARVSVGIQTIIKLFYRPTELTISAKEAAEKLAFQQTGQQLSISNPTPYYITLSRLKVDGRIMNVKGSETGAMLPPFSKQNYPFTGAIQNVSWTTINDFGGESVEHHTAVKRE